MRILLIILCAIICIAPPHYAANNHQEDEIENSVFDRSIPKVLEDLTLNFQSWMRETKPVPTDGVSLEERYFGENLDNLVNILTHGNPTDFSFQRFLTSLNDLLLKPCDDLTKNSDRLLGAVSEKWSQTTKLCNVIQQRYLTISEFVCRQLGQDEQDCANQADLMLSMKKLRTQLGQIAEKIDMFGDFGVKKLLDEHLGTSSREEL